MSEWLKERAWKLTPAARADAHQIPPTHSRSTTSRNNDLLQRVPVNDGVAPGFGGVCDTVLTQDPNTLGAMRIDVHPYASRRTVYSNASDVDSSRFASICCFKSAIFCSAPAMASAPATNRRGGGFWSAMVMSARASFTGSPDWRPFCDFQ